MGGKSSFFILIAIVAFLSLTLAMLAGYVFFVQGGEKVQAVEEPKDYSGIVPKEEDLVREKLLPEKTFFNLKSDDPDETPVIVVNLEITYFKKTSGIKDTTIKIASNKSKLIEIVGTYFQSLYIKDVMDGVKAKEKARNNITLLMNDYLKSNENDKSDIIYTVTFEQWFYQ